MHFLVQIRLHFHLLMAFPSQSLLLTETREREASKGLTLSCAMGSESDRFDDVRTLHDDATTR